MGGGRGCKWYITLLEKYNIPVELIIDNRKRIIRDYKVVSLERVKTSYSKAAIVVSALDYINEITSNVESQCLNYRVFVFDALTDVLQGNSSKERKQYYLAHYDFLNSFYDALKDDFSRKTLEGIIKGSVTSDCKFYNDISNNNQYFPSVVMDAMNTEEVFCDIGAFDGDTIRDFIIATNNQFKKIIALEPDDCNFLKLRENWTDSRIELYKKGAGEKTCTMFFRNEYKGQQPDEGGHCVDNYKEATASIEVVRLDDIIDEKVTFIKMDIEGMELGALKGANAIITKYRPKLAICVYHKTEDIVEIPRHIINLNLEYKLYLRHYWAHNGTDTVLFAI